MNGELQTITVMADLPAYTAFASVADPSLSHVLKQDRETFYERFKRRPVHSLAPWGRVATHLVEGHGVEAIVDFLARKKRTSWSSDYTSAISTYRGYGALFMNWHRKRPAVFSGFINRGTLALLTHSDAGVTKKMSKRIIILRL